MTDGSNADECDDQRGRIKEVSPKYACNVYSDIVFLFSVFLTIPGHVDRVNFL